MGSLELQVGDGVVFAHYMPPDAGPNNGGYLGRVFPGGSFLGIGYDQLFALGTGAHHVLADERSKRNNSDEPGDQAAEDRAIGRLRWTLFMYQVGACTEGEVLVESLLAMRPDSVERVVGVLPEEWRARLALFAADIPDTRAQGGFWSMSSSQLTQVPDENLVAVWQWFEGRAERGTIR